MNAQDVYRAYGHRNHQPDDYAPNQQVDFSHSPATTSDVRVISIAGTMLFPGGAPRRQN
jgi:hypothetical protein